MTPTMADPQPNIDQGQAPTHPQPTGPNMKAEALRLGRRGWPVLPLHSIRDGVCTCSKGQDCGSAGKHPRIRDWVKSATTDAKTIASWWTRWRDANIGIATGRVSNLVVLDVDPRHGGDDSLDALIAHHGQLPDTVEALTGGGGRHIYFAFDGVDDLKNSVGSLGDGLDIRSEGGYVVAPPSMHASGIRYEWEASSHPDDIKIAAPPRWITAVASYVAGSSASAKGDKTSNGRVDPAAVLAGVPEGERNDTLFKFASRHRGLGLDIEEALALALTAAANADPPLLVSELSGIVNNVYSRYEAGPLPSDGFFEATASGDPRERFHIHWGNEVERLPPPEWLIDDIMPRGSFVVLYGVTGTGKTFLALDMAAAIAAGQTWQGHNTFQGPVVYVAAEGVGDLGIRHEALRVGRGLDDLPDLGYITEPVNFHSDVDAGHLIDLIGDRKPGLVVVDTLARSMDGADENFAKDMNTVIKNVDRLRHATGASVMLIHHTGQKGDRERGSSALKAAADVFIKLSGNVTTTATLRCEKMKTATGFDPISLCFEPTGQSLTVVSGGVTPTLKDRERDALTLVSTDSLSHKAWLEAFISADHGEKATFERALKSLKDKGFVEGGGGVHRNLYVITDAGREALGLTGPNEVSGDK
jgi:hypothetical protein